MSADIDPDCEDLLLYECEWKLRNFKAVGYFPVVSQRFRTKIKGYMTWAMIFRLKLGLGYEIVFQESASNRNPAWITRELVLFNGIGTQVYKAEDDMMINVHEYYEAGMNKFILSIDFIDQRKELFEDSGLVIKCKITVHGPKKEHYVQDMERVEVLPSSSLVQDLCLCFDGGSLMANREVLSSCSPIFATMLKQDMVENLQSKVNMPDIDYKAGTCLLQFIYTGSVELTDEQTALSLIPVADMYMLPKLKYECEDYLLPLVNTTNAPDIFPVAELYKLRQLKMLCTHHLKHIAEGMESRGLSKSFFEKNPRRYKVIFSVLAKYKTCILYE